MKRLLIIFLIALMVISCVACKDADAKETPKETTPAVNYHPPHEEITVSPEEQQQGYGLYQGWFYYEGGAYYFYDPADNTLYWLPELMFMPDDFFSGFSTGDTVKIKGDAEYTRTGYVLNCRLISIVHEGTPDDISDDVMERFEAKDAINHE